MQQRGEQQLVLEYHQHPSLALCMQLYATPSPVSTSPPAAVAQGHEGLKAHRSLHGTHDAQARW
jgi:hypothetical protein